MLTSSKNSLKNFPKKIAKIFFPFSQINKTMPFNPELIKVSKSNKYSNLTHDKDTITFALKDCFSYFGLSYNKKFKNYSIGINIKEKLFARLKAVEAKAETFLDRPLTKPLLRCLVEKGEYKNFVFETKTGPIQRRHVRRRFCRGFWSHHGNCDLQRSRAPVPSRSRRRNRN